MPPTSSPSDNSRGILSMLAACACFIATKPFVKLASADIPLAEIVVGRSLIALPVVALSPPT
jgi:hypothetical protein